MIPNIPPSQKRKSDKHELTNFYVWGSNQDSMENSSDEESDSEKKADSMLPLNQSIQRHFKLIPHDDDTSTTLPSPLCVPPGARYEGIVSSSQSETDVVKTLKMKIAYSPKDQVTGLKRRWKPIGANTTVPWDPSLNEIQISEEMITPKKKKNKTSVMDNKEIPASSSKKKKSSKSSEKKKNKKQKKEKMEKKIKAEKK